MPESYAPLDGRRRAVTVVFAAIVVLSIAAVLSDLAELRIIDRLFAGEDVSDAEITSADDRQRLMGFLQFAAYIGGAVVFIRWMHRAYQNMDVFAWQERRWGHGWAIGAWFVPILNLWRPKQIVNDIWRAGKRDGDDREPGWLLLAWWLAFIGSGIVDRIVARGFLEGDSLEDARDGTIAYAVSDGLDVVAAVLAIFVVRTLTDRLDDRARAAATPPPGPDEGWQAPGRPAGLRA